MLFVRKKRGDSSEKLELKDVIFKTGMFMIVLICVVTLFYRNQVMIDRAVETRKERAEASTRIEAKTETETETETEAETKAETEAGAVGGGIAEAVENGGVEAVGEGGAVAGGEGSADATDRGSVDAVGNGSAEVADIGGAEAVGEGGAATVGNGAVSEHDRALEFVLHNKDGEEVRFSEFRGKVVFMAFWSPWDSASVAGMGELAAAKQTEGFADKATILMVYSVESLSGLAEKALEIAVSAGLGEDDLFFDIEGKLAKAFFVESYPVTFVFDGGGRVRDYKKGLYDREDIIASMNSLRIDGA